MELHYRATGGARVLIAALVWISVSSTNARAQQGVKFTPASPVHAATAANALLTLQLSRASLVDASDIAVGTTPTYAWTRGGDWTRADTLGAMPGDADDADCGNATLANMTVQAPALPVTFTRTGHWQVTFSCTITYQSKAMGKDLTEGPANLVVDIDAVGVDHLQYGAAANPTDIAGTLYILSGAPLPLSAVPAPADAAFPAGQPVWGGTAGAAGTGATALVTVTTVTTAGTSTVTATCGDTVTANLVV